ncbi:winged helix-turn-helix transcriptional regulator [Flavitalea sp.]|nr:helix-turn-helix domain-containing protein [Flavitalea sp.]
MNTGNELLTDSNVLLSGKLVAAELHQPIDTEAFGPVVTERQCNRHLSAVGDAMYVIGGKWKLRIIVALKQGNKRFNDLQRAVTGISARVLSTELKDLELNGFVSRHVYPYTPVTVEYLITDYTETLEPVLLALGEWGHRHREKVMADSRNEREAHTS